jgi:hypothetical protein
MLRTPNFATGSSATSSATGTLSLSVRDAFSRGLRGHGVPRLSDLTLALWPKQREALDSPATEILYGGQAGGGKSHLFRVAAITWAHEIQGLQLYFFRRELPDLLKNHMEGPTSFPELLGPWMDAKYARINWSKNYISIGKSRIHLCHCQHEKDVYGYQGAEIHVLFPDELTQFTDSMYRYLRGRVRMGREGAPSALVIPKKWRGRFPRVMAGSNPGGIGHNAVKGRFVDPKPKGEVWRAPRSDGGMLRQFIPAALADNPALDADEYSAKLEGLAEHLRKAMLDGDWNIVAGGMFDDLWNPETAPYIVFPSTLLTPADIPKSWTIDRALDWGSSKPFSIGWWAESDGTQATLRDGSKKSWPRGTLIRIGEWYGTNGNPNEGCKMGPAEVAKGILEREEAMGIKGRVLPGPADSSIFEVEEGDSIGDKFARAGVKWEEADKSPGSRKNGAEDIRERLRANVKREGKGLVFLDSCRVGIRLFPTLPRDLHKSDDVDTKCEDHDYDMTRYRCMFQRRRSTAGSLPFGGG